MNKRPRSVNAERQRTIAALAIQNRLLRALQARCSGFAVDESIGLDGCYRFKHGSAGACRHDCRIDERSTALHFEAKRTASGATVRKGAKA